MLDPRRLLVLDAVLRAGSMSSAAYELRYSPAAVSQQIAALENEVGVTLLKRVARGVEPTSAGAVAARHARQLADRLSSACAQIDAVARGVGGALRVASFPAASASLLPETLFAIAAERSELSISVEDRATEDALAGLRDGTIDVALVADVDPTRRIETDGLDVTELLRAALLVMLPRRHRLANQDVIPLAHLLADRWIQTGDALCAATVAQLALEVDVPPQITTYSKDLGATRGLVAAGFGIALVSELLELDAQCGVVIRPVRPQPSHPVLILTPAAPLALPAAELLRNRLLEAQQAPSSSAHPRRPDSPRPNIRATPAPVRAPRAVAQASTDLPDRPRLSRAAGQ